MRIYDDIQLDYCDVLLRPKRSTLASRSEVIVEREYTFKWCPRTLKGTGIVAANMATTGTFEIAREMQKLHLMSALHKHYSAQEDIDFFTGLENKSDAFYSLGIGDAEYEQFCAVMKAAPGAVRYVCIDVANGYTEAFVSFVKKMRDNFPDVVIMAGNVVTGDMTEELILAGADIVKVGIGPGSVCTTRKMTGVGYPQLSAVIECADAAHGLGGRICSDGGCTQPGDIAKAFGGGADFVMLGGMFAGHNESGGEVIEKDGKKMRAFYGMSSKAAMDKYSGGVAHYRAAEGKIVYLDDRGPVDQTCQDILGGVRSACTYVGARKLKELTMRTTFVRVTQQLNEIFGKS